MGRMRQGWELTKKSWGLLRENKQLFRFPIYGALTAVTLIVLLAAPGAYLINDGQNVVGGLLVALGVYGAYFTSIFFGVGLASTADGLFHGRDATFSDGIAVARSRIAQIAGWAALSALVGMIISALQRGGSIGEVIAGVVIGTAWALISFMSIPVIAFEGTGPWATLKRSGALFKDRWAGQVTGNVAIGGIVFLLGILPAILMIGGGGYLLFEGSGSGAESGGVILIIVGAIVLAVAMLISQAMSSIFSVALYRYAIGGEAPATFTEEELRSAVRTK